MRQTPDTRHSATCRNKAFARRSHSLDRLTVRHCLDRALLGVCAIAVLVVIVIVAEHYGSRNGPQIAVRLALAGYILMQAAPWFKRQYVALRDRWSRRQRG